MSQAVKKQIEYCSLLVNIDGLPLAKSSVILISLYDSNSVVTVVGIYHGNEKPVDPNCFLKEFVEEAIHLTNNGIVFKKRKSSV
ncbi:hypothetical protein NQ314_008551 [Rhamnusium bicolor]|uniref:Uncharacterized protein n=1 Tax=Rhamnusium bicolor TaxID=1586634 RepID=A0AAV8YBD6_9CUCU|nr:hypothetical protein NQ314_008551 [Rhamnusium bicolor]